jgi:2-polyprenyl-3-methyl-5-hydroxy-6-metoxy-1,4-benzoquinol methylase
MKKTEAVVENSSFRDPSGTVFECNDVIYRQINECYRSQYERLMSSGLYTALTKRGFLIQHTVAQNGMELTDQAFVVIKPERIPFISYPYEWSFGMLRDAALLTLRCHLVALDKGMILKDASAYNIQFKRGTPVLIDTLSFDFYQDGMPWVAYGQFCRHFLAPLLLMCNVDIKMNRLLELYIDGIPLDMASLFLRGKGGFFAKQHIVWHAKATQKHAEDGKQTAVVKSINIPKHNHIAMIDSMIRGIEALKLPNTCTEWADYYAHTNYSSGATEQKGVIVTSFLADLLPKTVWDIGANDGTYSRLALEVGASVVAFDIDMPSVERNYTYVKKERLEMLPLVWDAVNPSPAIGFANSERKTVFERQKPDCILALAVIHHLAISNNLPLEKIASWFASMTDNLIIEFVPKEDSQVQVLLATRTDIFTHYTQAGFEAAFSQYFSIKKSTPILDSVRTIYYMEINK